MNGLSRLFIDEFPDIASLKLLPFCSKLRFGLLTHIYLHANTQKKFAGHEVSPEEVGGLISQKAFIDLLESLRNTVKGLSAKQMAPSGRNIIRIPITLKMLFEGKKAIVAQLIEQVQFHSCLGLGRNTGEFSRLASDRGIYTVAFDVDPGAVSQNYIQVRRAKEENLYPP